MRMPKAHQSTAVPWPVFLITSGARYSGVPQRVYVSPAKDVSPQSQRVMSATAPRSSMRTVVNLLCESEIHQLQVAIRIDQDVLRL